MKYAKAIVAVIGAALTAASTFVAPGSTWGHIVTIALAAVTAAGVYAVPNTPAVPPAVAALRWQKTAV